MELTAYAKSVLPIHEFVDKLWTLYDEEGTGTDSKFLNLPVFLQCFRFQYPKGNTAKCSLEKGNAEVSWRGADVIIRINSGGGWYDVAPLTRA